MRDYFKTILTDIAKPVREAVPNCFVAGERIKAPTRFPTVMVVEADNYVAPRSMDNSLRENLTVLMYEVTVFSNLKTGKRQQCADILSTIDDVMRNKNGTRISRVEGYFDSEATIYMMTARYRFAVDDEYYYTYRKRR